MSFKPTLLNHCCLPLARFYSFSSHFQILEVLFSGIKRARGSKSIPSFHIQFKLFSFFPTWDLPVLVSQQWVRVAAYFFTCSTPSQRLALPGAPPGLDERWNRRKGTSASTGTAVIWWQGPLCALWVPTCWLFPSGGAFMGPLKGFPHGPPTTGVLDDFL